MKVNTFILALKDNNGANLKPVHNIIHRDLLETFGGCTRIKCNGSWIDDDGKIYDEEVIKYEVAFDDSINNQNKFVNIVKNAGVLASQLAMYYTLNTQAHIINIEPTDIYSRVA